jgi:hypothetical protein
MTKPCPNVSFFLSPYFYFYFKYTTLSTKLRIHTLDYTSIKTSSILIAHKGNERKKECVIITGNDKKNIQVFKVGYYLEYESVRLRHDFVCLPSTPVIFFKMKLGIHTLNYTPIKTSSTLTTHTDNEKKEECVIITGNDRKNIQVFKVGCYLEYESVRLRHDFVGLLSTPVIFFKMKLRIHTLDYTSIKTLSIFCALK